MSDNIITTSQQTPQAQPPARSALRPFRQPAFLIAAGVLLVAALGLNASVASLKLHFKKEPVPLRKSFTQPEAIPRVLGPWVRVAREEILDADMLASLATNEFLFCHYVDSRKVGLSVEEIQKLFAGKNLEEQRKLLMGFQKRNPDAAIQFYLTHYTGKADTVAHIPERCYVGSGYDPKDAKTETWSLANNRQLNVRHITFEHQSAAQIACDVAYFFHSNGSFESDSLMVRAKLQSLRARYGYYTKAELMCPTRDRRFSEPAMKDFLSHALPALEAALPDWEQYRGK
jgi:cytochrome c551/c552